MENVSLEFQKDKSLIQLSLTKTGIIYEQVLQAVSDIKIEDDHLDQAQKELDKVRQILRSIESIDNPYREAWARFNEAKKSLFIPMSNAYDQKMKEFSERAKLLEEIKRKEESDRVRKQNIQNKIATYILQVSSLISSAQTDTAIVLLQKKMGSEKTRRSEYQEFLPEMCEKLDALKPKIDAQKEIIRKIYLLKEKNKEFQKDMDDEQLHSLEQEKEALESHLQEARETVQQTALENTAIVTESVQILPSIAPKPRRQTWGWEISDMQKFAKSYPDKITIEVKDKEMAEVVKPILEQLKKEEREDYNENGLHIYLKKFF